MSDETQVYLGRSGTVRLYECVIFSHPNFTQTYRFVRNKVGGLTATLDSVSTDFSYYPLRLTPQGDDDDLDYGLQVDLGEVGDIASVEFDAVEAANGFGTKPSVQFMVYRSDDLTAPFLGPVEMIVSEVTIAREGISFLAHAPRMNDNQTGVTYTPDIFPGLAGLMA